MNVNAHAFEQHCVAGLAVTLFGRNENAGAPLVFVTHGRTGQAQDVFAHCHDLREAGFVAVAIEQRNHGRRLVDVRCNLGFGPRGGVSTFGVLVGTAMDVVALIDFLPACLGVRTDRVGMTGFSLGGFATLAAMALEPRIAAATAFIAGGCFYTFMEQLVANGQADADSFDANLSPALTAALQRYDAVHNAAAFADRPLLLVNGGADELVTLESNRRFEAAARPHYNHADRFRLSVHEEAGHEVNDRMWAEGVAWLRRWLIESPV